MASVFSPHAPCFHSSSDHDNHLTHSPHAGHCFDSSHHIPDSGLTVELIHLLTATIVKPSIRHAPYPLHGTVANDADVSTM
jgi:hypothetical protein